MSVTCQHFDDLSTADLYVILQARCTVFTVEQNCVYQDVDGLDKQAFHMVLKQGNKLAAYCRILPAGVKFSEWAIGRVLTVVDARGQGLSHQLIKAAIDFIAEQGAATIRISAQEYLTKFYASHGFIVQGDVYLEDGIPHVEMLREGK